MLRGHLAHSVGGKVLAAAWLRPFRCRRRPPHRVRWFSCSVRRPAVGGPSLGHSTSTVQTTLAVLESWSALFC